MFKPTVAIMGASAHPHKYGNISLRAHLRHGFEVYPVNLKGGEIEGLPVYRRLADIPVALNRISMYVPPEIGITLLDEIAEKGCDELFFNPGSADEPLLAAARQKGLEPILACSIVDVQSR